MAEQIKLDILTPMGPKRDGVLVDGVEVPGIEGELGVLPHHEALVTAVVPGVVRFRERGQSVRVAVGAGFLEVRAPGQAILLVERAVEAREVKRAEVEQRLDEVERELGAHQGPIDDPRAAALRTERQWLQAQLRVAE